MPGSTCAGAPPAATSDESMIQRAADSEKEHASCGGGAESNPLRISPSNLRIYDLYHRRLITIDYHQIPWGYQARLRVRPAITPTRCPRENQAPRRCPQALAMARSPRLTHVAAHKQPSVVACGYRFLALSGPRPILACRPLGRSSCARRLQQLRCGSPQNGKQVSRSRGNNSAKTMLRRLGARTTHAAYLRDSHAAPPQDLT